MAALLAFARFYMKLSHCVVLVAVAALVSSCGDNETQVQQPAKGPAVVGGGFADLSWLSGSTGWTGSKDYLAARPSALVLVQDVEDTKLANMDVDTDYALGPFGDFLSFAPSPVVAQLPASEPTWYQRIIARLS